MTAVQKKGEELIEHCRNQGNIPVSLEQSLSNFSDRWNSVGSLIDDRRHKAQLARRRRDVQDLMVTLEAVLKDVERVTAKFGAEVPENDYEMKSQLELCKVSQGHASILKQDECFPSLDHFFVPLNLCFKTSLHSKPFI